MTTRAFGILTVGFSDNREGGIALLVKINGADREIKEGSTVSELIGQLGVNPATVIIEHNKVIIGRDAWLTTIIKENDCLEILAFVGGG